MAKQKAKFIFATHLHDLSKLDTVNNLDNVGHYHLKVHYRNSDDTLIYDRQLENGPGDAIYGLEVAKYVIQDNEFNQWLNNRITFEEVLGTRRFRYERNPNAYNVKINSIYTNYL